VGGGGGGGPGGPGAYIPTGIHEADMEWQDIMRNLSGLMSGGQAQTLPLFLQSLQQMEGIPTGGLTQAGQQAGAQYGNLANLAQMYSGLMGQEAGTFGGAQQNLMGAGNQLWQTALDPNNALRNRLLHDVQEQTRAGDTARGIAMSPQSAGLEADAKSNFMQNWEQNQLQRQLMGAQGMGSLYGQAGQQGRDMGQMLQASMQMGQISPQMLLQAGITPFQLSQMAAGWPMQAGQMFNQAMGGIYQPWSNLMGSMIPYMNQGLGATNQAFNQGQVGLNNLTSGLGQLAGLFGGNPSGGYGVNPGWDFNPPGGWVNLGGGGGGGADTGAGATFPGLSG